MGYDSHLVIFFPLIGLYKVNQLPYPNNTPYSNRSSQVIGYILLRNKVTTGVLMLI